jgi:RNA polymerase sigma-70 factor (ECF subfamily)
LAELNASIDNHSSIEEAAIAYREPLLRYFQRRAPSHFDAEDLVQEVFLRLSRQADIGSIQNMEAYLFRVASNALTDQYRNHASHAQAYREFSEYPRAGSEVVSPEQELLGRESISQLVQALDELPRKIRDTFVLYHFASLRYSAIAQRMGVSISTVEKRMAKANAHLLKRVGHRS